MSNSVDLRRVRWFAGLLLRPEHFARQDDFVEALALWRSRFLSRSFGLIGGGPRRFLTPISDAFVSTRVRVTPRADALAVSVEGVRGVTACGGLVEVPGTLNAEMPVLDKGEEAVLYVVRSRAYNGVGLWSTAEPATVTSDVEVMTPTYVLTTRPLGDDLPWALAVARLRNNGGVIERDDRYLPLCVFVSSHRRLAERVADIRGDLTKISRGFLEKAHTPLRLVVLAAQRVQVFAGEYAETLAGVAHLIDAIDECGTALEDEEAFIEDVLDAMAVLTRRTARVLDLSISLQAVVRRAEIGTPFAEIATTLAAPLSPDTDLARRLDAFDALLRSLEAIYMRVQEVASDFRRRWRYNEVDLAFDVETPNGPYIYRRIGEPIKTDPIGSEDLSFEFRRLTDGQNMDLNPSLQYMLVLFGQKGMRLGEQNYVTELRINDEPHQRLRGDSLAPSSEHCTLGVKLPKVDQPLRSLSAIVSRERGFTYAALYRLETEPLRTPDRVFAAPDPEYIPIQLFGDKGHEVGEARLRGTTRRIRVRLDFSRPRDKGGKGGRRTFEVHVERTQVWSLKVDVDPTVICRWNNKDTPNFTTAQWAFPEFPETLQLGVSDMTQRRTWFLTLRFKKTTATDPETSRVQETIRVKLDSVSESWPQA